MPTPDQPSPTPPKDSYEAMQQRLREENAAKLAAKAEADAKKPRRHRQGTRTPT